MNCVVIMKYMVLEICATARQIAVLTSVTAILVVLVQQTEQPFLKSNTTVYVCKKYITYFSNVFHFTYFLMCESLKY